MYTGRDALYSVEQAIGRVRAEESQLDDALRSAIEEAARLRREEADGFRVLARIRLDEMTSGRIVGDLDATERRALAMIESQRAAMAGLSRRRDEAQAALQRAEALKHDRDEDLAKTLVALDGKRAATQGRISTDPAWQAAKAAVDAAESVAKAAADKAKLAEDDLGAKRKVYEDDPLFMYLWTKKHGEETDRSGNFVRFVDRKVARFVRYHEAKPNYAMLLEIPLRLREHANARQAEVQAARDRLGEIERRALDADGAGRFEGAVETARRAVADAERAVMKANTDLEAIERDRQAAIGQTENAAFGGAVELLAQSLAREDMRQLYAEAYRTATPQDEQALNAIQRAREALSRADQEVADIRRQIREQANRRTELEGARDRARGQGYDSPLGSVVSQTIIANVITGILQGAMRGTDLDRVLRDNYQWQPQQSDPDFGWRRGGGGGGGGGGGPWGGSWGGGGGGQRDSGGGGWQTTDKF